jgi:hypothetical protein
MGVFSGRKENMTNLQSILYHIFNMKKTKKIKKLNFFQIIALHRTFPGLPGDTTMLRQYQP